MIIREANFVNLHGHLDIKVNFREGVNVLIGGNGSGKTSVLNTMAWISFAKLLVERGALTVTFCQILNLTKFVSITLLPAKMAKLMKEQSSLNAKMTE